MKIPYYEQFTFSELFNRYLKKNNATPEKRKPVIIHMAVYMSVR